MIQAWKYDDSGVHKRIATWNVLYGDISSPDRGDNIDIKSEDSSQKTLTLKGIVVEKRESFLDYVFGGCEIGLQVAIDLTLSNGEPMMQDSLHFWKPEKNAYLQAIQAVGGVLQSYDHDQLFPTYGFGGKYPDG